MPDNGAVLESTVREMARHAGRPELTAAIDRCATFATTVVDRITPRTTDEDLAAAAAATGLADAAPVVTEPFAEWVIMTDTEAARIVPLAQGPLPAAVRGILTFLGPELAADLTLVDAVRGQAEALCAP